MSGFGNVTHLVDAEEDGQTSIFSFRKQCVATTLAGYWYDYTMSTGNPSPIYYASTPLESVAMSPPTHRGFNIGSNVYPKKKFIKELLMQTNSGSCAPSRFIILDYLLYYPFIAEDTTDPQILTNSATLPRYTDGEGVQMMMVSMAGRNAGVNVTIEYTNQDGISGRTTAVSEVFASANGQIITTNTNQSGTSGPFIKLMEKDTGVRSVEVVTTTGTDVGLFAIVLVKPLFSSSLYDATAPHEWNMVKDRGMIPIEVQDGAVINFIMNGNSSMLNALIMGMIRTVWR